MFFLVECIDVPSTVRKYVHVSASSMVFRFVVVGVFFYVLTFYWLNTFFFQETSDNPNPLAKAELNLLAHLVGGSNKKQESKLLWSLLRTCTLQTSCMISRSGL